LFYNSPFSANKSSLTIPNGYPSNNFKGNQKTVISPMKINFVTPN